jgi:hypothetical protein
MMIGIAAVRASLRAARQISRPSTCGSIRSRISRSGARSARAFSASRAGRQHLGRKPCLLQVALDELGNVAIVFDDEHARHRAAAPAAIPLMVRSGASANAAAAARASKRTLGSRLAEIDIDNRRTAEGIGRESSIGYRPSRTRTRRSAAVRANHRRTAARAGRPS